jgi:hypothetical protein
MSKGPSAEDRQGVSVRKALETSLRSQIMVDLHNECSYAIISWLWYTTYHIS